MIVGVPKEIKVHESRVAVTPEGVSEFVHAGHTVLIEDGGGMGQNGYGNLLAAPIAKKVLEAVLNK